MKKLLLLGGSTQQIVAIKTAKKLGYYTVLCDYLPDNPGQYEADHFYLVSTTDREAVLQVAKEEKVDGVIAYASDPAAPTAAFVSEKLGLPTNPLRAVEIMCNKDRFRSFLLEHGLNAPVSKSYTRETDVLADADKFRLPVIIKPVDSSGSKGATVVRNLSQLEQAVSFAFSFSRSHKIIVEDFIEKAHPYLVGGDIFINDGKIILWGLLNCHRDSEVNPLVPVGKSYPLLLNPEDEKEVRTALQKMVDGLGLRFGSANIELVVDKNHQVWLIDVGPRAGGNMIPDLLGLIYQVDVVEMGIRQVMGEQIDSTISVGQPYYATHNLHSSKTGRYQDILFSKELEPYIIRKVLYKKAGDEVHFFSNASDALGIVFLKFPTKEELAKYLGSINDYIQIEVEEV